MLYSGVEIKQLIAQRDPILMIDALVDVVGDVCHTQLTVRENNFFIEADDRLMSEPGLIEHIAQSAGAMIGHRCLEQGGQQVPACYLGEVKKFHCHRRPGIGEVLETTITLGATGNNVTQVTGETKVGDEVVADTQIKIITAE